MAATGALIKTAQLTPELFDGAGARASSKSLVIATIVLLVFVGFGFRVARLGAEGLSEDELNKLHAVEDYRAHGLTGNNGEHPLLMKALMAVSIIAIEQWNASSLAQSRGGLQVSTESALRLPSVIFGALTSILIFLIASELFGTTIGLLAASLWAFDPQAIGFNRIGKEDTFLLFFFLLANVFWLRGQRAAESGESYLKYCWATAASCGAMMASKYMPHLFAIGGSYYHLYQEIPATRWRMGNRRWLIFALIMGVTFVLCNPTILLPETWQQMRAFAGERRIAHDSYEYLGLLYRNQMSLWLNGLPWHFYYVFIAFKLPLLTVVSFIVGLPLLFRRRLGDGRFFILFWLFYWFFPFTLLGGKFLRYFTLALPVVLITAAIGAQWASESISRAVSRFVSGNHFAPVLRVAILLALPAFSLAASASITPFYRLYTNIAGGGHARAGAYFPHDEFYDGAVRDAAARLTADARPGALIATETPELLAHYVRRDGRNDLRFISLSDGALLQSIAAGDWIVLAEGRRYISNDHLIHRVREIARPTTRISLGDTTAIELYLLDDASLQAMRASSP